MSHSRITNWVRRAAGGLADTKGVSAVEFALLSPLFALLIAGVVDLGGMLSTRFGLDGAVSAASNYAIVNAAKANQANAASLAATLGAIVAGASSAANGTIIVNNGATATITKGVVSTSGASAAADACYCPTLSGTTVNWGTGTCGTICTSGMVGGKFVAISTQQPYVPILVNYGIVKNGSIQVRSVVQVQ
jgi:Flp pilus assembly protein TadG